MSRARGAARALGVVWLALGAALLLVPSRYVPAGVIEDDGLAHALAFAVAVALWIVALPSRGAWVLVAAVVGAAGSEVAQGTITPSRGAEWTDVAANLGGIAVGLAVGLAVSKAIEGWERWAPGRRGGDVRTRRPR